MSAPVRQAAPHARVWVLCLSLLASVLVALWPTGASALDRTFAGSAQLDYHLVPERTARNGTPTMFEGFTLESAAKLSVDISDRFSANIKMCFGCHGFETDMAHVDFRVADELSIRAGRFSPSFGSFNLRHDPANHRLSDKPLAYDMGRMLRMRDWNQGVLPSPFPDNGVEVSGTHWFGQALQLDYAAHAVSGFKADAGATDLDFLQSRSGSLYYVDNNARPSFGGRVALTARFSQFTDATLGASVMTGTFDPNNDLWYTIAGGDLAFRFNRVNLRFEYLVRRQDLDVGSPGRFKYEVVPGGDYFLKHGTFAELEVPVTKTFDLIGRFDFMYRSGNVAKESPLAAKSGVFRYTLGASYVLERGLRAKVSTEYWSFSDLGVSGRRDAMSMHLSLVGAF
jgi:hypothetical protein